MTLWRRHWRRQTARLGWRIEFLRANPIRLVGWYRQRTLDLQEIPALLHAPCGRDAQRGHLGGKFGFRSP